MRAVPHPADLDVAFRKSWEGRYKATLQTALRLAGAYPESGDLRRHAAEHASDDLEVLSALLNLAGAGDTGLDPNTMLCLSDMLSRINRRLADADELIEALGELETVEGPESKVGR